MIKVSIEKALLAGEPEKAAFSIVKESIERSFKLLQKEIDKEGGSVKITITGPGTFAVDMDKRIAEVEAEGLQPLKKITKTR